MNSIELIELEHQHRDVFSELIIDENSPGTVLKDFNTTLDLIAQESIPLAPSQRSFLSHWLPIINDLMSYPQTINHKHLSQKAYPHISGLFLLLRCSGLTHTKRDKKEVYLTINPIVFSAWKQLNPTEQYLNLLRVWLLNSSPEVIGEKGDNFRIVKDTLWLVLDTLDHELVLDKEQEINYVNNNHGYYNLALCRMFGFIEVDECNDEHCIATRIRRTALGKAIFSLVLRLTLSDRWYLFVYQAKPEVVMERWWQYFRPYFPKWETNLFSPNTSYQEGLHIFKINLDGIWRRVALSGEMKLSELCDFILDVFDLDHDHLYSLEVRNHFGITISYAHPDMETPPSTESFKIGEIGLQEGDTFDFIYDFGNRGEFRIFFEELKAIPINYKKRPILLGKSG